jgi:hypothetical protein
LGLSGADRTNARGEKAREGREGVGEAGRGGDHRIDGGKKAGKGEGERRVVSRVMKWRGECRY